MQNFDPKNTGKDDTLTHTHTHTHTQMVMMMVMMMMMIMMMRRRVSSVHFKSQVSISKVQKRRR